jgi:DNA polymerase III alpha subunit
MAGGKVSPPCVNRSEVLATLIDQEIFIGLSSIEGFNLEVAERIVEARRRDGSYTSLHDFIERVPIGIEHMELLIFAGAFRFAGKMKNELILETRMVMHKQQKPEYRPRKLFEVPPKDWDFPKLQRNTFEDAFDEIEILGFPVSHTPFELLRTAYRGDTLVSELLHKEHQQVRMVGYLVARKDVPTNRGHMNFGTWVDVEGQFFDTTHFPNILIRWPFKGPGCYLIQGKVMVEFGFPTIEVEKIDRLPMIDDPRYQQQRSRTTLPDSSNVSPRPLTRAPYPSRQKVDQLYRRK